jgi:hypothetical protein
MGDLWVNGNWHWGRLSSEYAGVRPSISFHQYLVLVLISVTLLPETQVGKAANLETRQYSF